VAVRHPASVGSSWSGTLPIVAAACAGASAWCSAGALAVIDARAGAPRIGILPSLLLLPAFVAGALVLARLTRLTRERAWPLFVPLVAFLPWIPGPVPLWFLIWTGPILLVVWAVTLTGVLLAGGASPGAVRAASLFTDPRRAPLVAALVAAAASIGAAAHFSFEVSGDEPHYLIVTQSILHDFDLQIENNHRAGQFTSYVRGELKPDYLRRGTDGQIYSIHAPGLPAIIAPAFAFFGHRGVSVFLALVSAVAGALVWRACRAISTSASAAWFGWMTTTLTVPFFFQSFAVYPDALGAAGVMCGVFALLDRDAPRHRLFWYGAALALLPWLHTRLAIPAVAVGLAISLRVGWRAMLPFAVAPLASAIGWLAFFHRVYGSFSPAAPYGGYTQTAIANVPAGLLGLLFDQQFGLVPNAPVFAVAAAGLIPLARRSPRLALELVCVVVPYAIAASAYHMWWGGHSTPGRFLVAVLLPMALPAALAFDAWTGRTARFIMLTALAVSLTVTAMLLFAEHGRLIYNPRDGFARWLEWAAPLVDLPRGLPSVLRDGVAPVAAQTTGWFVMIAAGLGAVAARDRVRPLSAGQHSLMASLALLLAFVGGVEAGWWRLDVRSPAATTSQLALLRAASRHPNGLAIKFSPLQRVGLEAALGRLDIASSTRRPREPEDAALVLGALPAGVYRVHVRASGAGTVDARIVDGDPPFERWSVTPDRTRETDLRFMLPIAVSSLSVRGEGEGGFEITLRPVSVMTRHVSGEAVSAARYGSTRAFVLDGRFYAEPNGIWLGAGHARILLEPPAKSLFLRNTNLDNVVSITASGIVERLSVDAREERTVTLPPSAEGYQLLGLSVDEGMVPAVVDPGSADFRNLGCWIEVRQ
jgi:hypothetical protein